MQILENSYIIEGKRIPTGKKNGYYKNIIPEVFTSWILRFFKEKYPFLNSELDEVILGCAIGTGGNMARYALLEAGFDTKIPATTIDYQCGSSLKAILIADAQIQAKQSNCVLVGGMESNSLAPKRQYQPNDFRFLDSDTFYETASFVPQNFGDSSLIKAAENVAYEFQISKKEMMDWTVESHQKASKTHPNYQFQESILEIHTLAYFDQTIKKNITTQLLKSTQTENLIDHTNTAHLHDGATVLMMASENLCIQKQITPKFQIIASAISGGELTKSTAGVLWATEKLLSKYDFPLEKIDLFEINESFALKPLIFSKHFKIPLEKVNIFGGNLAFGHPFGASGAMNLLHLMKALEIKNKEFGLVSMGVAGGLGISVLIKRLK